MTISNEAQQKGSPDHRDRCPAQALVLPADPGGEEQQTHDSQQEFRFRYGWHGEI